MGEDETRQGTVIVVMLLSSHVREGGRGPGHRVNQDKGDEGRGRKGDGEGTLLLLLLLLLLC